MAAAALLAIPSVSKSIFGAGENTYRPTPFQYDPNAFQYGGAPGAAEQQFEHYQGLARAAARRSAPQAAYGQAQEARRLGLESRARSQSTIDYWNRLAAGREPSIAQAAMRRESGNVAGNLASGGASARGGGPALALAQAAAQEQTGRQLSDIAVQGSIAEMQERQGAHLQAYQALRDQRAQDLQLQGLDASMAQYQADMEMKGRIQNDQKEMGLYGLGEDVRAKQLAAQMAYQGAQSGQNVSMSQLMAQINAENAMAEQRRLAMAIGAATGSASTMASMFGGGK